MECPMRRSEKEARESLEGPVSWDKLRLHVGMVMRIGLSYNSIMDNLREGRLAHSLFNEGALCEMLARMMFWRKLDESLWPKYSSYWGSLTILLEDERLPEDNEPENDDTSRDQDWQMGEDGDNGEEEDDVTIEVEASGKPKYRKAKRRSSPGKPQSPTPSTKFRIQRRSRQARKDYEDLPLEEKAVVEIPDADIVS
ncbi:hypothetical protein JG688_00014023 [Phytophthora aleatoria]|uniref:Uncharacterized protein n=1 Tax=Phytophthora aleatoria TaxID=2496075 RepID=A0A8J5M3J9_9STRA|nr:hypothetical protein JG688_00014023 [Phytophthora aleatoria]